MQNAKAVNVKSFSIIYEVAKSFTLFFEFLELELKFVVVQFFSAIPDTCNDKQADAAIDGSIDYVLIATGLC